VHEPLLFCIYLYVWRLYLRLSNINFHQLLLFIISYYHYHYCYCYWTSELLLNSILKELYSFFLCYPDNCIEFWKCPSCSKWHLHKVVNSETKSFRLTSLYSSKLSWNFSRKLEYNDLANRWKMIFQASDLKGNHFLDLVDGDNRLLELSYIKGGLWLQNFGHSNLLCTRATRAITNHALIGKYRLRFFPSKEFSCPCGQYPIESRWHILHECKRFNKYWNSHRDFITYFVMFLECNQSAFAFSNATP